MTVLALMNIWLYGLGGQEDILIGTPVSNRNHTTETEKLIGLFLNTLVLRNQVAPDPVFPCLPRRRPSQCLGSVRASGGSRSTG